MYKRLRKEMCCKDVKLNPNERKMYKRLRKEMCCEDVKLNPNERKMYKKVNVELCVSYIKPGEQETWCSEIRYREELGDYRREGSNIHATRLLLFFVFLRYLKILKQFRGVIRNFARGGLKKICLFRGEGYQHTLGPKTH